MVEVSSEEIAIENLSKERVSFDSRIQTCSDLVRASLEMNDGETRLVSGVDLSTAQLEFVRRYLEMHDYDISNCKVSPCVKSCKFEECIICPIDANEFANLSLDAIASYLKAAAYLQINPLTDLCVTAIACKIYVNFDDVSLSNFRRNHQLPESLSLADIQQYRLKYGWGFCPKNKNNHNNNKND